MSAGGAVAIVLSPAEFARPAARGQGAKADFAKHLVAGVDMNEVLETSIERFFEDYQ